MEVASGPKDDEVHAEAGPKTSVAVLPSPSSDRSRSRSASHALPTAVVLAASGFVACLIRALMRRGSRASAAPTTCNSAAAEVVSGTATPATPFAFGSPLTSAPQTPAKPPGLATEADAQPAASAAAAAEPTAAAAAAEPVWDAAALRTQMSLLKDMKEMQEENKRLRDFMATFMATSEKVQTLEAENQALKEAAARLEADVREIRSRNIVADLSDLELFKQGLGMPTGARSVCSLGDSELGGPDTSASVDGGAVRPSGKARRTMLLNFFGVKQPAPAAAPETAEAPTTPGGSRRTSRSQMVSNQPTQADVTKTLDAVAELFGRNWSM